METAVKCSKIRKSFGEGNLRFEVLHGIDLEVKSGELLMLVGPMTNKFFTRKFIRNNVNVPWKGDNSKIRKELKMEFRPLKQTMEDAFQNLIDEGILKAK